MKTIIKQWIKQIIISIGIVGGWIVIVGGLLFLILILGGCGGSGIGSEEMHNVHDDPVYCQNVNPNCTPNIKPALVFMEKI